MNNNDADTADTNTPYISNFPEGESLLDRLPFDEPQRARQILNHFLDALLNPVLDNETVYRLLEKAAESAGFVANELSKEYLGQSLILSESQESTFQSVIALWKKMADRYAGCIDAKGRIDFKDDVRNHAAVLYRCIHYTALSILEHQRARQEYVPGLVQDLNAYYARAERAGIDSLLIPHPFEPKTETYCAATYIVVCLCDMADRHRLSAQEQTLVLRWAFLWAQFVGLRKIASNAALPPLVLDLTQDRLLFTSEGVAWNDKLRSMDTSRLLSRIWRVNEQLQQQVSPMDLDLGPHCTVGQCLGLLKYLSQSWGLSKVSRKFRRLFSSRQKPVLFCTGFEELFFHISGKPFRKIDNEKRQRSSNNFEMQFIFRTESTASDFHVQISNETSRFAPDTWKLMDQSLNGLRLACDTPKRKVMLGQLVAVTLPGETSFVLGDVVWAIQGREKGLTVGIRVFVGKLSAVTVRFMDETSDNIDIYHPGFLLEAFPSLGEEKSLLLPARLYRPNTRVELANEEGVVFGQAVLQQIIENGTDFDRIRYLS